VIGDQDQYLKNALKLAQDAKQNEAQRFFHGPPHFSFTDYWLLITDSND